MPERVRSPKGRRKAYFKEWRLYRGLTQQRLADRMNTTKANISRIETGIQAYTQDYLEACAEALNVDPASLIMRDPTYPAAIWSLWEQAKPGQRKRIVQATRKIMKIAR